MSDREFEVLVQSPGPIRYEYFIKRVADRQHAWTLGSDEAFVSGTDDSGNPFLPLWPHPRYAESCRIGPWADSDAYRIELDDLITELIPDLMKDRVEVGVFPLPDGSAVVVHGERLATDLNVELEKY